MNKEDSMFAVICGKAENESAVYTEKAINLGRRHSLAYRYFIKKIPNAHSFHALQELWWGLWLTTLIKNPLTLCAVRGGRTDSLEGPVASEKMKLAKQIIPYLDTGTLVDAPAALESASVAMTWNFVRVQFNPPLCRMQICMIKLSHEATSVLVEEPRFALHRFMSTDPHLQWFWLRYLVIEIIEERRQSKEGSTNATIFR